MTLRRVGQGRVIRLVEFYLMPGLVGGGYNHSVADGESDEEVDDVREVRGQLGHGLAVEAHEVHLAAAIVDFVQELRVRCDVFLLQDRDMVLSVPGCVWTVVSTL